MYEERLAQDAKQANERLINLALSRQRSLIDIEKMKEKELKDKLEARYVYLASISKVLFNVQVPKDGREDAFVTNLLSSNAATIPLRLEVRLSFIHTDCLESCACIIGVAEGDCSSIRGGS